jgi:hypothetical protein
MEGTRKQSSANFGGKKREGEGEEKDLDYLHEVKQTNGNQDISLEQL